MFPLNDIVPLFFLMASAAAFELQQSTHDVQTNRGFGFEELALFLVGLGVASALGLSIIIGPLFAFFYASMHGLPFGGVHGGNTVSTTADESRVLEANAVKKHLLDKIMEGLNILGDALKKYHKV